MTLSTRPPSVTIRPSRPGAGSVRSVGPGVEDLDVGHPLDRVEVLDQAVALVMAGIALRRP